MENIDRLRSRFSSSQSPTQSQGRSFLRSLSGAHRSKVKCIAWSEDGKRLATGGEDGQLRVWPILTSTQQNSSNSSSEVRASHSGEINQVNWNPLHSDILASGCRDKSVRLFDLRLGMRNGPTHTIVTPGDNLYMAWNPADAHHIAVGCSDDILSIIDVRMASSASNIGTSTGTAGVGLVKAAKFDYEINEIGFSFTGSLMFLTTGSGAVNVYDTNSYTTTTSTTTNNNTGTIIPSSSISPPPPPIHTINAHTSNVYSIDMDPKGRYLATGGADALAALIELEDMTCVHTFGRSPIRTLSFTHDGELLASGSEDRFIDISHVETGEQIFTLKTTSETNSLKWHPNRYMLAYIGEDMDRGGGVGGVQTGIVRIFNVDMNN